MNHAKFIPEADVVPLDAYDSGEDPSFVPRMDHDPEIGYDEYSEGEISQDEGLKVDVEINPEAVSKKPEEMEAKERKAIEKTSYTDNSSKSEEKFETGEEGEPRSLAQTAEKQTTKRSASSISNASTQKKSKKLNIGPNCPVCNRKVTRGHSQDAVIAHFDEELKKEVDVLETRLVCKICKHSESGASMKSMLHHVVFDHRYKLDKLLEDEELMSKKRSQARIRFVPKEVSDGFRLIDVNKREHVLRSTSAMVPVGSRAIQMPEDYEIDEGVSHYQLTSRETNLPPGFTYRIEEEGKEDQIIVVKVHQKEEGTRKDGLGCRLCGFVATSAPEVTQHFNNEHM